METKEDVKKWYLNDSYNTIVNSNSGVKLSNNYRIACTIPQSIIDLLKTKQSSEQIYLGSNLSILMQVNGPTLYDLYFYTYYYDSKAKNYLIGRAIYNMKNFSIDYNNYLCSKKYISLEITADNLDFTTKINTQAYKQNSNIGTIRLDLQTISNINFSILDIYTEKNRKRYALSIGKNINFYSPTPVYIYDFLSRTPSTCVFASELVKQLQTKMKEIKAKSIEELNLPIN